MSGMVFSVHTTKPDDVGAVEIIFSTEHEARKYAQERSTDQQVLAASVARFVVGELGTRHPVAWYVDGTEQPHRFDRRLYPTGQGQLCIAGTGRRSVRFVRDQRCPPLNCSRGVTPRPVGVTGWVAD